MKLTTFEECEVEATRDQVMRAVEGRIAYLVDQCGIAPERAQAVCEEALAEALIVTAKSGV
jgi:hypothetical protein